jgi:hypothetical protein
MNLIPLIITAWVNNAYNDIEILVNPNSVVSLEKDYDNDGYYLLYLSDGRVLKLTELQYQEQFIRD